MNMALFSVAGGKFHKPSQDNAKPWRATKAACGLTVTPLNYFVTIADANAHTGWRLSTYMCKRCEQTQ